MFYGEDVVILPRDWNTIEKRFWLEQELAQMFETFCLVMVFKIVIISLRRS